MLKPQQMRTKLSDKHKPFQLTGAFLFCLLFNCQLIYLFVGVDVKSLNKTKQKPRHKNVNTTRNQINHRGFWATQTAQANG